MRPEHCASQGKMRLLNDHGAHNGYRRSGLFFELIFQLAIHLSVTKSVVWNLRLVLRTFLSYLGLKLYPLPDNKHGYSSCKPKCS